jgi:hypothetical protein
VNAALITQNPANFQQKLGDESGVAILNFYPPEGLPFNKVFILALVGFQGLGFESVVQ